MGERNNIVVNGIHGNFQSCPVVLYRRFVYLIISTMGGTRNEPLQHDDWEMGILSSNQIS